MKFNERITFMIEKKKERDIYVVYVCTTSINSISLEFVTVPKSFIFYPLISS